MSTYTWNAAPPSSRPRTSIQAIGWQVRLHAYSWSPPTDVYETEDSYIVRVEVAGMSRSDFSITVDKEHLVISGVRSDTPERRAYHQMEIRFGEFSTAVEVPPDADITRTEAEYADGFLTVILPKIKAVRIKAS
ncbi:MAG: Hsp20/alpha crystallin family protein [Anaerolineales bacterium]